MKILPVEAALFHADRRADGQTNTTKLTVAFRNFVNAPNKKGKSTQMTKQSTRKNVLRFLATAVLGLHLNFLKAHKFASYPDVTVGYSRSVKKTTQLS
jgi:hypothetical protein